MGDSIETSVVSESMVVPQRIGLYKGETGQYLHRGIVGYQEELNVNTKEGLGPYSLDTLVTESLRNAEEKGRTEVTVFDFGCGDAVMFHDLLDMADSQTTQYLREHPNINLRLLGLTDTTGIEQKSKDTAHVGEVKDILSDEEKQGLPSNVQAHVVYYSVTAAQPLDIVFQQMGVNTIDLGVSVQALSYIYPKNLDRVLRAIINHLEPDGGKFIAAPYAERVAGFNRGGFGHKSLDVRTEVQKPGFLKALQEHGGGAWNPDANLVEEKLSLQSMINKFKDLGVLSDREISDYINHFLPRQTVVFNRLRRKFSTLDQIDLQNENAAATVARIGNHLYYLGHDRLGNKKFDQSRENKHKVLERIKQDYTDKAEVQFGERVIDISTRSVQSTVAA